MLLVSQPAHSGWHRDEQVTIFTVCSGSTGRDINSIKSYSHNTEEQLLCQCENGIRADPFAVEVTLGSSALNKR